MKGAGAGVAFALPNKIEKIPPTSHYKNILKIKLLKILAVTLSISYHVFRRWFRYERFKAIWRQRTLPNLCNISSRLCYIVLLLLLLLLCLIILILRLRTVILGSTVILRILRLLHRGRSIKCQRFQVTIIQENTREGNVCSYTKNSQTLYQNKYSISNSERKCHIIWHCGPPIKQIIKYQNTAGPAPDSESDSRFIRRFEYRRPGYRLKWSL